MSGTLLFAVTNHHTENCGEPPQIDDSTPNHYRGYFENEHGEQAIFVYDRTTHEGTLYMGDAGWERHYAVVDGAVPELILDTSEALWLRHAGRRLTAAEPPTAR